jgi:hypothetical protein
LVKNSVNLRGKVGSLFGGGEKRMTLVAIAVVGVIFFLLWPGDLLNKALGLASFVVVVAAMALLTSMILDCIRQVKLFTTLTEWGREIGALLLRLGLLGTNF